MNKVFLISVLFVAQLGIGCKTNSPITQSATQPSPRPNVQPAEPTQAEAPTSHTYNDEKYRIVNKSDEIVSVLENGATVIVKHVDSPVVAMRAYTYTGGVFEGKWLGGGL